MSDIYYLNAKLKNGKRTRDVRTFCEVSFDEYAFAEGNLYTWGDNIYGQLGYGDPLYCRNVPVQVDPIKFDNESIVQTLSTVALTASGRVYTWGPLNTSLVENPKDIYYPLWRDSFNGEKVISIHPSYAAITESGKLYTWGENTHGRLGDGTDIDRQIPTLIDNFNGEKIIYIDMDTYNGAAITETGKLYTWGYNYYGQLGDGTRVDKYTPTLISPDKFGGEKVIMVNIGYNFSLALTESGKMYTWGYHNYYYTNYNATLAEIYSPTLIDIDDFNNEKIIYFSKGHEKATAITESKKLYILNSSGVPSLFDLDGEKVVSSTAYSIAYSALTESSKIYIWDYAYSGSISDLIIIKDFNGEKVIKYTLGGVTIFDGAAITESGNLYSWGANITGSFIRSNMNSYGLVGDGTLEPRSIPVLIDAFNGEKVVDVYRDHYSSALTESGKLYTWGINAYGELADGTLNFEIPTPNVVDSKHFDMEKIKSVALGDYHTLALTNSGKLYTWGVNLASQLGDDTLIYRTNPELIDKFNGEEIINISVANNKSAAVTKTGKVYYWGEFYESESGVYSATEIPVTLVNRLPPDVIEVHLLSEHALALTSTGKLYIWVTGIFGVIADYPNLAPRLLDYFGGEKVVFVSADYYSYLIITESGRVFVWGNNETGKLGLGHNNSLGDIPSMIPPENYNNERIIYANMGYNSMALVSSTGKLYLSGYYIPTLNDELITSNVPILIDQSLFNNEKIIKVQIGHYHILALTENNTLYSWGNNRYGQLGLGTIDPYVSIKTPQIVAKFTNKTISDIKAGREYSAMIIEDNV